MKCPTPCYSCGRIRPLHKLHFHTAACNCRESCCHGLCEHCFTQVESRAYEERAEQDSGATNQII